jgi:hypothetical protein
VYFEQIAKITANHLNEHLPGYLSEIQTEFTGTEIVGLGPPQQIRVDSLVGGVFSAELDELPLYALDALTKGDDPIGEDLYTYQYLGHIVGMVSSDTSEEVTRIIKRHEWAVEKYIREHQYLHFFSDAHFRILQFDFIGSSFSGAESVLDDEDPTKLIWINAFRIDVAWRISEDGSDQHQT